MSAANAVDIGTPESELHVWALREFLRSWEDTTRHRQKESRQDYWFGYRQGLIDAQALDRFRVSPI